MAIRDSKPLRSQRPSETVVTDARAIAAFIAQTAHQDATAPTIITERDGSTVAVLRRPSARQVRR